MSKILLLLLLTFPALAQLPAYKAPDKWLGDKAADWIGPTEPRHEPRSIRFVQQFTLPAKPERFVVNLSADQKYVFWVNGQLVGRGPVASDLQHWRFHTYDIAPLLVQGNNMVAVLVTSYGTAAEGIFPTHKVGLWFQPDSTLEQQYIKKSAWYLYEDGPQYQASAPNKLVTGHYMAPPAFNVNAQQWFRDTSIARAEGWILARYNGKALYPRPWWYDQARLLVPSDLPAEVSRATSLRLPMPKVRQDDVRFPDKLKLAAFLEGKGKLTIPANSKAEWLLDHEEYVTGYPSFLVSGNNAKVSLAYAEALADPLTQPLKSPANALRDRFKGDRSKVAGKDFIGFADTWHIGPAEQPSVLNPEGIGPADRQLFLPHWRAWRFLKLTIETTTEPLVLKQMAFEQSGFPFQVRANFEAKARPDLSKMMQVGWRTAQACANDIYMDCPYYEQQQYIGDTRIQALVSLYMTGDHRLMRQALLQASYTINSEGMVQSRYPATTTQYIPGFGLWWVCMLHDYALHVDDPATVRALLPTANQILHFFQPYSRKNEQGNHYLTGIPYWTYVDWVNTWTRKPFRPGMPHAGPMGESALNDLQYLLARQAFGKLSRAYSFGDTTSLPSEALLKRSITSLYWQQPSNKFADHTPLVGVSEPLHFSQHTQALAVLAGVVTGPMATDLMRRTLVDSTLQPASVYFKYYVQEAACLAGLAAQYASEENLKPWHDQLKLNLTTWAEEPEPSRSDCHAWGSSPNVHLLKWVVGMAPAAYGYQSVTISPELGDLTNVNATIPHAKGLFTFQYEQQRTASGTQLKATIELPAGVVTTFLWRGQTLVLQAGKNVVVVKG